MTELTEKTLAKELRDAVEGRTYNTETSTEEDWQYAARRAAELLGVNLPPEPKPLPTKPGSVIIATEVRGVKGEWRMMLDHDGDWYAGEVIDGLEYHRPGHITKWIEARVVPVTPAPVTLTEDQVGEEWNKHRGTWVFAWGTYSTAIQEAVTATVNAILAQYAAPAEGELIDLDNVRKGDRVRVVMKHGNEAMFTVRRVDESWVDSGHNAYRKRDIHTIHLLHREE